MSNHVTVVGNITAAPELRYTASGQATVKFSVADNRRWQNKATGEWEESVSFHNVVAWQTLAENIAESLSKGNRVVVTGRLEQRSWEQDGQKRYAVEIVADEVAPSLRWATAKVEKVERSSGTRPATAAPAGDFGDEPF